jgi:NAD(P)-dependent dehydrogenase (short-subunit alcohol dehydrogenase family)
MRPAPRVHGTTGVGAYSAAKSGLQMFTRLASAEWGPKGIRVNAVACGMIATPLAQANWATTGFDAMGVLERIYAFIGMDIPDDTRAALGRRIEEKPELQHGVHRYDIADFGMTEGEAREPFGDYIQRYDLVERRK